MMNNEPVAWMSQGGDVSRSKRYFEELGFTDLIPLHPVKELTKNIAGVLRTSDQSIQIVFTSCRSASEFEAILRKAQEK